MLFKQCEYCINYSKRYKRCKLKEENITSFKKGKCQQFSKIPESILAKNRRQDKLKRKIKDAKNCIGCLHNQEGWCAQYKVFAFHARNSCLQIKTRKVL